jgi:RNA polymerase sigma factor (sigma-70 family)
VSAGSEVEGLLRELAPQVLAALVRRHGQFDMCEDAVQEALLAAATQWPVEGVPDSPRAWLVTVGSRRLADLWRSDSARRRREEAVFAAEVEDVEVPARDDTLTLLFLCCHPALTPASQVALTVRAVGGLTTAQVARAFLVPEATMAQRISRSKAKIKAAGARFSAPPEGAERDERLRAVLHVLYLIFNEGYTATAGEQLVRGELTGEAVRLTRAVRELLPGDGEVAGLLALMLLTEARGAARSRADGSLVPLAEQDRSSWDAAGIAKGVKLVSEALSTTQLGPYQLQAAIAAVHAEAPSAEATDWAEIAGLYALLAQMAPNPVVTLNHAVAVAMVRGPEAGLAMLAELEGDDRVSEHHRVAAVRAHLLEMAGDVVGAKDAYLAAARLTLSMPEQRYLLGKAENLS